MALLEETSRVAFAALIHDLGKFAQRAEIEAGRDRIETHKQWYCPPKRQSTPPYLPLSGYTYVHAAYTALGFDAIEKACGFDLRGDQSPFDPSNTRTPYTDSLINAAARHHQPETLLQWVVATADRVASGFEREKKLPAEEEDDPDHWWSFMTRRKYSLLEEIRLDEPFRGDDLQYRKPLRPFSVQSLFPRRKEETEPADKQQAVDQYRKLWEGFLEGCQKLGDQGFQDDWPLWLDAFDTLWLTYTESIPSATAFDARPDVSLYDHSKATAALAAALWRWCREQGRSDKELIADLSKRDWGKESLLLIQGDFFGIQNFIFSSGSQTDAKSAKILRGRSFYVSLLTEACALRILEALDLPSTSQITNAAGKFLIVAPNTEDVREKLEAVRSEVDAWFLEHTFGETGIGIAAKRATLDKLKEKEFPDLLKALFAELEVAKLHRFDLFGEGEHPQVLPADYSLGVCAWHGRWPADKEEGGLASCAVSRDEIRIGEALVKNDLLLLVKDEDERPLPGTALELPLFGYKAIFAGGETEFNQIRLKADVRRVWDFSMPEKADEVLWKGFARRSINGFIPRVPEDVNPENHLTYRGLDRNDLGSERIEPFSWIARENLFFDEKDQSQGVEALCHLKGDVDQLGRIFQEGLDDKENENSHQLRRRRMNFAKMASLSREMNAFFSVYAPWLCSHDFPKIYTVFAGGDDFSFIGPWKQTQDFATKLQQCFKDFAARNHEVHFSAGMSVVKSGMPVRVGSEMAEEALSNAKSSGRDSVSIYGECVKWTEWEELRKLQEDLETARKRYSLSTSYLYSLFQILELAREEKGGDPQASIWRSRFYYRTARLAEELKHAKKEKDAKDLLAEMPNLILRALEKHGGHFRVPLTNLFYRCRRMRS